MKVYKASHLRKDFPALRTLDDRTLGPAVLTLYRKFTAYVKSGSGEIVNFREIQTDDGYERIVDVHGKESRFWAGTPGNEIVVGYHSPVRIEMKGRGAEDLYHELEEFAHGLDNEQFIRATMKTIREGANKTDEFFGRLYGEGGSTHALEELRALSYYEEVLQKAS